MFAAAFRKGLNNAGTSVGRRDPVASSKLER